jgi:hypothetical protein
LPEFWNMVENYFLKKHRKCSQTTTNAGVNSFSTTSLFLREQSVLPYYLYRKLLESYCCWL